MQPKTLCSDEPEEHFKPFEPEPADVIRTYSNNSSDGDSKDISSKLNPTFIASSPTRSSALLPLSPQRKFGNTEKLTERAGDGEDHLDVLASPHRGPESGASAAFRGGLVKRPPLANRLSFLDRKWLERCQVFGEMEAEERPGGGNQEIKMEKAKEKEQETEDERGEKDEKAEDGERKELKDFETKTRFDNNVSESTRRRAGQSKAEGARKEERNREEEETEGGQAQLATPGDDSKSCPKSQSVKKKRRKRPREGDNVEGSGTEEEGVKKRRRNCQKKEEHSLNSNDGGGETKRRTKRKGKEHGEEEVEEKETKVSTKVRTGLMFILYSVFVYYS